jgi:hypothetical protein
MLLERLGSTQAAVVDDAHCLATKCMECVQAFRKQDRAKRGDVPSSRVTAADELILRQCCQDSVGVRREWPLEEIEVRWLALAASPYWNRIFPRV